MRRKTDWRERYITGDLPWDTGRCDFNLKEIVTGRSIQPCKALEVGCGTGSNAIWLCGQGFSVTAVDISGTAVRRAIKKSSIAGLRCKFFAAAFMREKISGGPFGFVFDRGCFHSFDSSKERSKYAKNVNAYLKRGGLWLTLVGSADEPPRDIGPPRCTAGDIATAVEPYFKILTLYTSHFDSNTRKPPKIWVCLMRKRE